MPASESERESLFGESMTLDEIESQSGGEDDTKKGGNEPLDGDDIPDEYKGKSAREIMAIASAARDGMRMAESARSAAESARTAADALTASRQTQVATPEPELTREQLQEMYDKDPLEAIEKIEQQAMRRIEAHVASRIEPLTAGTMSSAENWAKEEYPDEFELFGDNIKKLVDSVPNKSVFTTKKGWEDAVAYVRGQKDNFEKLIGHRQDKDNRKLADDSRSRERGNVGFSSRSVSRRADDTSEKEIAGKMSDEQRAIAQRFVDDGVFKNLKEYNSWYNKGEA